MADTRDEAIAALAQGSASIAEGLAWFHANEDSPELHTHHGLLNRIAERAEQIAGVPSGTFAIRPADGTPKPPNP